MRLLLALTLASLAACDTASTPASSTGAPAAFQAFTDAVTVSMDGSTVVVESTGVPDHGSPYFPTTDARYVPYAGTNARFQLNPNRIQAQTLVFRIPSTPTAQSTPSPTPLGPIGVSLNGVPFYNQYAGPNNRPLANEVDSFDQFLGHPQQTGQYHYHVEPVALTATLGRDALLGFLLDGYPVYGPEENGATVLNSSLDAAHGHEHATAEYPGGVYHYHVTDADPYINGAGFHGTPGTVSQ